MERSEDLIYVTDDGTVKLEVAVERETLNGQRYRVYCYGQYLKELILAQEEKK